MAKSSMALGQYRGKMGGMVFRKGDNGQQVISAYQPVVKNPRTDSQMLQRAKFNLAAQVAKQIPLSFIYSLGSSARLRRGALISSIVKAATARKTNGTFVADINGANVIISKGPSAAGMAPVATFDATNQGPQVIWHDLSGQGGWVEGDKVSVVIGVFSVDGSVNPEFFALSNVANMSDRMYTYSLPSRLLGANFKAMVWVFVTRQGSNVNSASGSDASVPATAIQANLTLGTGLSALEYSDSMFAGVFSLVV